MNAIVIFGGKSFEHDISIITTLIILKQYKEEKYNILPVYVDKNDEWFYYDKGDLNIKLFKDFSSSYKKNGFKKCFLRVNENYLYVKKTVGYKKIKIDACLNCCHGGMGEDGRLSALFDLCHIPISTSNFLPLGICMDKIISKYTFMGLKEPVIDYFTFSADDLKDKETIFKKAMELGFPLILKPARLGSSIGIEVVKNLKQFEDAISVATEFDNEILVEKAILNDMKEYNVACMKYNDEVIVSQVDEPKRNHEILSFEDKYVGSSTKTNKHLPKGKGEYLIKKEFAILSPKLEERLKTIAKDVFSSLNLTSPARIDFIVCKNKIYINEINTTPGSLGYYFFVGSVFKNMTEYVDAILDTAIKEHQKKAKIKKEYITNLI